MPSAAGPADVPVGVLSGTAPDPQWYTQYGTVLKATMAQTYFAQWPAFHRRLQKEQVLMSHNLITLVPSYEGCRSRYIPLNQLYQLCLKSVFCYLVRPPIHVDYSVEGLRLVDGSPPLPTYQDLDDFYDLWRDGVSAHQVMDGRFAAGFVRLPEREMAEDLQEITIRHLDLCDYVQSRLARPDESDRAMVASSSLYTAWLAFYSNLIMMPTCRAVYMLMEHYYTKPQRGSHTVRLVLTGDDAGLKSGPVTFDSIPAAEILARDAESVVQVKLATALAFINALERREEAADETLKRVNDARRVAHELMGTTDASDMVEAAREQGLEANWYVQHVLRNLLAASGKPSRACC